jgi:hypothetical protein
MTIAKHLEAAVAQLEDAQAKIDEVRAKPATMENLKEWLEALTKASRALSDIQSFNNESVHEKLHALSDRLGMKDPG